MSSSTVNSQVAKGSGFALIFLGYVASIQGADPNIASTALLSAGKALNFGSLTALAASISTLVLAATVITTGMLADRLGRKKVITLALLLGIVGDGIVFLAADAGMYILGRALAGMAMGAIYGSAFAYVKYFGERSKGGLAVALGTFSAAVGLFSLLMTFAGASVVGIGWREAFLVIPVLCAVAIPVGLAILPKDEIIKNDQPWDVLGQLLLGMAVVLSLFGISHAADGLTSPLTVIPVISGIVLFVLFYLREKKDNNRRFFPVALLKSPLFLAAIGVGFLYNFSTGMGLLSFSNLFQYQLNLKGLDLSLAQIPYLLVVIPVALIVGKILSKNIMTRQMATFVGGIIAVIASVMFISTALSNPKSVVEYLPALIVLGTAAAVPAVPYGGMILQEADPQHYGVVSSSRTTIGQFWYSIGLAVSTIIVDTMARNVVTEKLGASAESELSNWYASGGTPANSSVLPTALEGFVQGFVLLMVVYAVLMLAVSILVLILGNISDKRVKAGKTA